MIFSLPVRPEPVEGRLAQTCFDKLSMNGLQL
jgi:hypothetical protein